MTEYKNLSGDSGVAAYELAEHSIQVEFQGGDVYLYTRDSVGEENLVRMKKLADAGKGLSTFISQHVRGKFAEKIR